MYQQTNHLKDLGHLLTHKRTDIPSEGKDDDDEVVHSAADGERLGVVVQAVASREVDDVHLDEEGSTQVFKGNNACLFGEYYKDFKNINSINCHLASYSVHDRNISVSKQAGLAVETPHLVQ